MAMKFFCISIISILYFQGVENKQPNLVSSNVGDILLKPAANRVSKNEGKNARTFIFFRNFIKNLLPPIDDVINFVRDQIQNLVEAIFRKYLRWLLEKLVHVFKKIIIYLEYIRDKYFMTSDMGRKVVYVLDTLIATFREGIDFINNLLDNFNGYILTVSNKLKQIAILPKDVLIWIDTPAQDLVVFFDKFYFKNLKLVTHFYGLMKATDNKLGRSEVIAAMVLAIIMGCISLLGIILISGCRSLNFVANPKKSETDGE